LKKLEFTKNIVNLNCIYLEWNDIIQSQYSNIKYVVEIGVGMTDNNNILQFSKLYEGNKSSICVMDLQNMKYMFRVYTIITLDNEEYKSEYSDIVELKVSDENGFNDQCLKPIACLKSVNNS